MICFMVKITRRNFRALMRFQLVLTRLKNTKGFSIKFENVIGNINEFPHTLMEGSIEISKCIHEEITSMSKNAYTI